MEDNKENMDICAICTDVNNESSITLSCKHKYHNECLNYSIKICGNECPYCRKKVRYDKIINKTSSQSKINVLKVKSKVSVCIGTCKNGNKCKYKAYPNNNGYCRVHKKVN